MIIKYAMYPVLLLETLLFTPFNIYLLWMWISMGQWDTIVNKMIIIQTFCGVFITLGKLGDFSVRLVGLEPSFMLPSTYCSCWLVFYKFLANIYQTSHLSMAIVRWICVKYPLEFHAR